MPERAPDGGGKPSVMIATPSYEGRPCLDYMTSMIETTNLLAGRQIEYVVHILPGDAFIAKARSRLASMMLTDHPACTDLLFIDDDICFSAEKVLKFLYYKEDIVCGICPKNLDVTEWAGEPFLSNGHAARKKNGLMLGRMIPTGFLRIKRRVLERMAEVVPWHMESPRDTEPKKVWHFFHAGHVDPGIEKLRATDLSTLTREELIAWLKRAIGLVQPAEAGEYWGEDFFFAQRWRQMGGSCWIDPNIRFTHRGSKTWDGGGTFADAIKDTPVQAIDEAEWDRLAADNMRSIQIARQS
jgi:hypothetical protein